MDEVLNLAYEIVNKRFNKNDEHYGLYVLGCYGLLTKFGDEYLSLIEKFFSECEFYIDDMPLEKLKSLVNLNLLADDDIENATKVAVSCNGHGLAIEDNKLKYEKIPIRVFCSTTDSSNNDILNCFIHEASHIVKSFVDAVIEDEDKKKLIIRCGCSFEELSLEDDYLHRESHNLILDEVINVFQTTDMMIKIRDLDAALLDDTVLKFYSKLDLATMDEHFGYDFFVLLTEKLWENECFKNSVENNIVIGNISKINDEFDQVTNIPNSFSAMADCLDCIGYMEDENEQIELSDLIYSIIELYNVENYDSNKINKKIKS